MGIAGAELRNNNISTTRFPGMAACHLNVFLDRGIVGTYGSRPGGRVALGIPTASVRQSVFEDVAGG